MGISVLIVKVSICRFGFVSLSKLRYSVQQEYIRGISAWNFNLEDLKNQAALVSIILPGLVFTYIY